MRPASLPAALLVLLIAAGLRGAWVAWRWAHVGPALEFPDEHLHWQLASHLSRDGVLVSDDGRYAARMPLYPWLLSLAAPWGPSGILAVRLGQALLGALVAVAALSLARAAAGPRAGLIAGLAVAIDPYQVFFANLLLTETLFTLVLMFFVAACWAAGAVCQSGPDQHPVVTPPTLPSPIFSACTRSGWPWVVIALGGPAAVFTRPSSAALVLLAWALLIGTAADRRRALGRVAVCAATMGLLLLPWAMRNWQMIGAPAWLSTNGGVTLYDAQGPQARGGSDQSFLRTMPELAGLGEVERDRLLGKLALEQMRRDPLRVLRLAGAKLARTWNPLPNVAEYQAGAAAWSGAAFTTLVLASALVSLWRCRVPGYLHLWLWLPVAYFTLLHCVYVGSVRYRVPLLPLLAVGAALCSSSRGRFKRP